MYTHLEVLLCCFNVSAILRVSGASIIEAGGVVIAYKPAQRRHQLDILPQPEPTLLTVAVCFKQ
jgi:hypothetical protein